MNGEIGEFGVFENYKYVVILSKYRGQILLSRHKLRTTWETQGGHVEPGEDFLDAAKRELFEESGALEYTIEPLFDYRSGDAAGRVFFAEIETLGPIPESEMAEVRCFDRVPENLTYPHIAPDLFQAAEKYFRSDKIE